MPAIGLEPGSGEENDRAPKSRVARPVVYREICATAIREDPVF